MYTKREFLVRSHEVVSKLVAARNSRLLGLEDNAAVAGAWGKGCVKGYSMNQVLREDMTRGCDGM